MVDSKENYKFDLGVKEALARISRQLDFKVSP